MKKLLITGLFLFVAGNIFGAELGAGGGSGYPAAIDTDISVETSTHIARADVPNDLADAIIKIETELGIDPSGGYGTVADRIDAFTLYVDTITDQIIDGQKTFTETLTVSSHVAVTGDMAVTGDITANEVITTYGFYHDRGTEGDDYDYTLIVSTEDGAWHDLDLSAIVPVGAKAVNLYVFYKASSAGGGEACLFCKGGIVTSNKGQAAIYAQVANVQTTGTLTVACDSNRVIRYILKSPETTLFNIIINGWWK